MQVSEFLRRAKLIRRYGAAAVPASGPWNDVIGTLMTHRSVRGYKPDAVPAGTLETMIAAAQSAATSSNSTFWWMKRRSAKPCC